MFEWFTVLVTPAITGARQRGAPYASNPWAQAGAVAVALLIVGYFVLPRRTLEVGAAALAIGAALCYWPIYRRRPRSSVSPELRRAATLTGLAAGSFRFSSALPLLAITQIARDVSSSSSLVQAGIALIEAVAVATIWWSARRLRRGDQSPVGTRAVVGSCVIVAVGLGTFALAQNGAWVLASLAVLGLPVATNNRFRTQMTRSFDQDAGEFQKIANVWDRVCSAGAVAVGGALMATPLGWRGVHTVAAVWFVVLSVLIWWLKVRPARQQTGSVTATPSLNRLKLWSVRRQLLLTAAIVSTAQLARVSLSPLLAIHGVGNVSFWAAVILVSAQIGTTFGSSQFAIGSHRSPRQMATRATAWLLPGAVAAALAMITPWAWLTVVLAFPWMASNETAQGGQGSSGRIGLSRSGEVASQYGALAGYVGYTIGAGVAALPPSGTALGLSGALLIGAVIALWLSMRTPRITRPRQLATTGNELTITLAKVERGVRTTVGDAQPPPSTGRGRQLWSGPGSFIQGDGDLLEAVGSDEGEELPAISLWAWSGAAWWPYRVLAWLTPAHGRFRDLFPWDTKAFVGPDFNAVARWKLAEPMAYRAEPVTGGVRLTLTLPDEMALAWRHRAWHDMSERPDA
jgi:hypothetical protein